LFNSIALLSLFICLLLPLPVFAGAQEGYRNIPLEEAYRLALETHEKIKIAQLEIDKSKLLPRKAWSIMLPHASSNGAYYLINKDKEVGTLKLTPAPGTPLGFTGSIQNQIVTPPEQLFGQVEISQAVYKGEFLPLRKKGLQTIDKNTAGFFQTVQDVLFQVAQIYYTGSKADELVRNDQDLVKLAHDQIRVAQSKFSSGAVTEDVVLNAELNLAKAETVLIKDKNELKMAKDTLCNFIGLNTNGITLTKPATIPGNTEAFSTLFDKALDYRFDYQMAKTNINLAKTDVTLQKSKFHPEIASKWSYYSVSQPSWEQESNNWIAAVTVKLPILEGGLRLWNLKESKESLRQTELSLDDLKRDIKIQVEKAMLDVENYKSLLVQAKKQVELAQKNYNIIFSKFNYGGATIFDLNQAFTSLATAKTELINKNYDYQMALLTLEKMEGVFAIAMVKAGNNTLK
jgi:outer membrane protein